MQTKARFDSAKKRSGQRGIVLVEALIAVLLFSLGILALVGLQATMTKNVTHSKLRAEASFLANQLIGQMWVDQPNLANYVVANGACTVTSNTKCSNWIAQVKQTLPGGGATITVNGTVADITVSWTLPGEGEMPNQFQINADITN